MSKGKLDPKFDEALELLKEEGFVPSVNNLKKRLAIGDARAKAILEVLEVIEGDEDLLGSSELPSVDTSAVQDGISPVTSEAPQELTSPAKDVKLDAPAPVSNRWAGSGPMKLGPEHIGYHPVTGLPVGKENL